MVVYQTKTILPYCRKEIFKCVSYIVSHIIILHVHFQIDLKFYQRVNNNIILIVNNDNTLVIILYNNTIILIIILYLIKK